MMVVYVLMLLVGGKLNQDWRSASSSRRVETAAERGEVMGLTPPCPLLHRPSRRQGRYQQRQNMPGCQVYFETTSLKQKCTIEFILENFNFQIGRNWMVVEGNELQSIHTHTHLTIIHNTNAMHWCTNVCYRRNGVPSTICSFDLYLTETSLKCVKIWWRKNGQQLSQSNKLSNMYNSLSWLDPCHLQYSLPLPPPPSENKRHLLNKGLNSNNYIWHVSNENQEFFKNIY